MLPRLGCQWVVRVLLLFGAHFCRELLLYLFRIGTVDPGLRLNREVDGPALLFGKICRFCYLDGTPTLAATGPDYTSAVSSEGFAPLSDAFLVTGMRRVWDFDKLIYYVRTVFLDGILIAVIMEPDKGAAT